MSITSKNTRAKQNDEANQNFKNNTRDNSHYSHPDLNQPLSPKGYTLEEAKIIQDNLPIERRIREINQILEMPVAELGLSNRILNMFEERGVFTVNDLLNHKAEDLLSIPSFGQKCLDEVFQKLEQFGFYRKK